MSDILATDWIAASWADARAETDPDLRAQKEHDAAFMEDAWRRSKYALAATRDQMTAAIGNTSLNIAERLDTVIEGLKRVDVRVGEVHEHVQNNDTLVSTFIETFPPQFVAFQEKAQAAWEDSARGLKKMERVVRAQDKRHGGQIEILSADVAGIKVVIEDRPKQRAIEARLHEAEREMDARWRAAIEARLTKLDGGG